MNWMIVASLWRKDTCSSCSIKYVISRWLTPDWLSWKKETDCTSTYVKKWNKGQKYTYYTGQCNVHASSSLWNQYILQPSLPVWGASARFTQHTLPTHRRGSINIQRVLSCDNFWQDNDSNNTCHKLWTTNTHFESIHGH